MWLIAILVLASLVGIGAAISAAVLYVRTSGTGRARVLGSHTLGTLALFVAGCMLTVGGCYKIVRTLYEPAKQAAHLARVQLTLQQPLDALWLHVHGPDPLAGRSESSFLRIQVVTRAGSGFTSQIPWSRMEVEHETTKDRVYQVAWQAVLDHATTAEGRALAARLGLVNDFRRVVRLTVQVITPTGPAGVAPTTLMLTAHDSHLTLFAGTASGKAVRDGEVWVTEYRDGASPALRLDAYAGSPAQAGLGSAVAACLAAGTLLLLAGVALVVFQHRVDAAARRLRFVRPAWERATGPLSGAGVPLLLLLLCFIAFNLDSPVVPRGASTDPQRAVARLQSWGVTVEFDEMRPDRPVVSVDFNNGGPCPLDAALEPLSGLTELRTLKLNGCWVLTDAGLAHLKGLTELRTLTLGSIAITDAGLVHLKGLVRLQTLELDGCPLVTDAGLVHLEGLTDLRRLSLKSTSVTDDAVKKLKQSLPDVEVSH